MKNQSERLQEYKTRTHLTNEQLGAVFGVNADTIYAWVHNRQVMGTANQTLLAILENHSNRKQYGQ